VAISAHSFSLFTTYHTLHHYKYLLYKQCLEEVGRHAWLLSIVINMMMIFMMVMLIFVAKNSKLANSFIDSITYDVGHRRPGPSRATAGPGKPLSRDPTTTSFCRHRDRGRKHGEECLLTIPLDVCGSIVSSPSRVRGGAPAENWFMHIWGQKEAIWNTLFSIFERWQAPKRHGAQENHHSI